MNDTSYEININPYPNQEFSVVIENNEYFFNITTRENNTLYLDLELNGVLIFQGIRLDANTDLLENYHHLGIQGQLVLLNNDDGIPSFERLGIEDKLYYVP